MSYYRIFLGCLALNLIVLLAACGDAPRNNIFDPQSELYQQSGTLAGAVSSKYLPYDPIPGVKVEVRDEKRFTETNLNGEYIIQHLKPGDQSVTFSAPGFDSIVESVSIAANQYTSCQVFMNGIPQVVEVQLRTRHIAHWQPVEDEYVLDVDLTVDDYDGSLDIDSVYFRIPSWNFQRDLTRGTAPEQFSGVFFNDVFDGFAFPEIQGELMDFRCKDKSGLWGPVFQSQITRLIISTPQTLSPAGLAVVDSIPVFRWSHFDAGFVVDYKVDIFRLDESAIPLHVLTSPVLADTTLRWEPGPSLGEARYYWILSVYDRYQNISVSREASFIVESP